MMTAVLALGILIFMGIHLVPSMVGFRASLIARLGEQRYKGMYSVLAGIGLLLIILGKAYADFVPVYSTPLWTRHLVWLLMLPALYLVIAANVPGNVKRFTPHPMAWAVIIWSGAHLAVNGDRASLILFAPFLAFAAFHIISANSRGASTQSEVLPVKQDLKIFAMAVATYLVIGFAHPWLFGMPAFV